MPVVELDLRHCGCCHVALAQISRANLSHAPSRLAPAPFSGAPVGASLEDSPTFRLEDIPGTQLEALSLALLQACAGQTRRPSSHLRRWPRRSRLSLEPARGRRLSAGALGALGARRAYDCYMDDECPHGMGDPSICTLCKHGSSRAKKITRSPSVISKHRRFRCIVCGVEKNEDQFPTETPPRPAMPYRNGDKPCRECRAIVRAERKARGGTYEEATVRVQRTRKGLDSST
jgi:hypothetical protein